MKAFGPERPIFFSTTCLSGKESLTERIQRYAHLGVRHVELSGSVTVSDADRANLKNAQTTFLLHNYFPPPADPFILNLASPDENIRTRSVAFARDAIDLCAELGISFYSVHAGFITDPTGMETGRFDFPNPPSGATEQAWTLFIGALNDVLIHAEKRKVRVLVENNNCTPSLQGKLLLQTSQEFARLFEEVSFSYLGILLDTGHLNVTCRTFGLTPLEEVDHMASHIGAFHISQNDGSADTNMPITENSWIIEVLTQERFMSLPVVSEEKFATEQQLQDHALWLSNRISPSAT